MSDRSCVSKEVIDKLIGAKIESVIADQFSLEIILDNNLRLYMSNNWDQEFFEITEISKNG